MFACVSSSRMRRCHSRNRCLQGCNAVLLIGLWPLLQPRLLPMSLLPGNHNDHLLLNFKINTYQC